MGRFWGPRGEKNNRRKHWICAKLTKTAGHQMASTIKNLRRKPLILRGKSHRSIGDFMGVNSPILRPILEGPPAHNPYCWRTDLGDTDTWAKGRQRSLPIRPYLHARITRITSVEQLPQTSRCKHWSGLSQGHCRRKLTCLPPSEPCQHITSLGEATIPADADTAQAPD